MVQLKIFTFENTMKQIKINLIMLVIVLLAGCSPEREDKSISWEEYEAVKEQNEKEIRLSRKDVFTSYMFGKLFKLKFFQSISDDGTKVRTKDPEELAKISNLQIDRNALLLMLDNTMHRFEFEDEKQALRDNTGCLVTDVVCSEKEINCTSLKLNTFIGECLVPVGTVKPSLSTNSKSLIVFFSPGIIKIEAGKFKNPIVVINEERLYIFTAD